jgi:hypothetical protein
MRFEPMHEKYRHPAYPETEEVYLARDSYPEDFYNDWVEDANNYEVDMVVGELVSTKK